MHAQWKLSEERRKYCFRGIFQIRPAKVNNHIPETKCQKHYFYSTGKAKLWYFLLNRDASSNFKPSLAKNYLVPWAYLRAFSLSFSRGNFCRCIHHSRLRRTAKLQQNDSTAAAVKAEPRRLQIKHKRGGFFFYSPCLCSMCAAPWKN